jgi:diguanylate cyclase (GGDEF)-like protein
MDGSDELAHARVENQVLSELARLSATDHPYEDVLHTVLDCIEHVVTSPFIGISVREIEGIGHYVRADGEVDDAWLEAVTEHVADMQEAALRHPAHVGTQREDMTAPAASIAGFTAGSRSGRCGSLVLASQAPLTLSRAEEHLMLRLAQQMLLVIDHALLLEKIEDLEVEDRLTGAINQHRLLEMLEYELQRHRYTGRWLALLMIDVQGLHSINRTYGRHYGNHILQKLAAMLQTTVRPIDVVARHGHDEFAVILPETNEEGGQELADELHERFATLEFAGGKVGLTAGVAHAKPDEILTAEAFLRRGEQALHEAKRYERGWSTMWGTTVRRLPS